MNAIQKERNKKLRDEIKNDLKVFKLLAEIRRNNEQQLEQELGIQKSLSDFHKPVTEKQGIARKEHFKAIKDAVENIPLSIYQPPPLQWLPLDVYNFDKNWMLSI
ncbi:hypothetical protein AVEN_218016-1 [Araneus ventricosus]|uniref:Uncharacterized protein n=1 Tax=Araneus ventricosus TaxID=182803 RepID=A0A4Y2VXH8_ARAVE|nr:hypothetical protein AVEN_218016-1 [Araneus ventricosus]